MKDLIKELQERNEKNIRLNPFGGDVTNIKAITAQTVQATLENARDNLAETVRGYRIRVTPEERDTILSALDVQL